METPHVRRQLSSGATALVAPDAHPETLAALEAMTRAAKDQLGVLRSGAVVGGGLTPAEEILFALADEWDGCARRAKLDEEWHIHRDSINARTANTRWSVYRSCAEELRRRLVDASRRQPTSNARGVPDARDPKP